MNIPELVVHTHIYTYIYSVDVALSSMMIKYWTNFAWSGDPNGSGLLFWPPFAADTQIAMNLDVNTTALPLFHRQVPELESERGHIKHSLIAHHTSYSEQCDYFDTIWPRLGKCLRPEIP